MPRSPVEDAQACAALWVVHTVQLAAYGRQTCTGKITLDGEPSPVDAIERKLMHQRATDLTVALQERADRLGLHPKSVEVAFGVVSRTPWSDIQSHFAHSLRLIGGKFDA